MIACASQAVLGVSRWASIGVTLIGIAAGVTIFLTLALRNKLLTIREWLVLPFGSGMLHLVQRLQRNK